MIPDTLTCLKMAAAGENEGSIPRCTRVWPPRRRRRGFNQVAALFTMVAAIEKDHEERYKALAANIEAGKVYARETEQVWQCRNCGFVYIGQHAPVECPVCAHPQSYFELKSSNYEESRKEKRGFPEWESVSLFLWKGFYERYGWEFCAWCRATVRMI